ncbi:uncharacterized protein DUF4412 [Lutibacter sp. Hel_I_33_5]|uniref:DUF4412 domain-containing protein n=1 Tax=Lutibacter sp. Hel_I_33_5 TaxID=1566289 RepID=UPI00119EFED5|nr:DUF4412 domain-containing protein [Lutibacter sp. Hel_I_33_5]TVZ56286.1 uncharacterized protein DUF4412 [Lutibacter sp. Hel_I_33_5]
MIPKINYKKAAFFAVFVFGVCAPTQAQFWKKLKKKVQNKVEQKVEEKLDKETDKVIDKTFDGEKKKDEPKIEQSNQLPVFSGGSGILKLYSHGYEYITKDIAISVYGKFTKDNLSNSVKTYNEDRVIKPVDAFPDGYALAFNGSGFLNPKEGQIIIHHADSKKVVFSLKGTWNTTEGDKPISGSYINLSVSEIIDKRIVENRSETSNKNTSNNTNNNSTNPFANINSNKTDIKIPSKFSFTSSLEVKMTSNDGSTADMEFLLGDYPSIYGMSIVSEDMGEGGIAYNVITPKSITMFINVSGMKMKKTVAQDQFSQTDFSDKVPSNPDELKKTGASKSILGFTCYEYKYTNEGGYVSVWATKDFPANNTNITMLGMREGGIIEGFVLEIDSKSGNDTGNMKAVKYNKNKSVTINTNDYKSMGF